ncbi:MAG: tRNA-dihydrouridine synthase family protein [Lachnospiraceae bacterium]|nr:tRNA-dihydrouridine synthase family protein [Lachnospiraceae bacterium]
MQYYLAPMEGITTYIYRNAHARYFGGIDKYFTPFISDKNFITDKNSNKSINAREIRDILPENNAGIPLVPQVLTNNAGRFLAVADKIASYGYDTVNLNLGCPSGTVTAKKRGAGFLSVPDDLDAFLYEIYEKCPLKISIKTRLGVSDLAEWDRLLDIYAKYPIHELIIHTRLQQEFYTGTTHPEAYAKAALRLRAAGTANQIPLCYNGDIVSAESLATTVSAVNHASAHMDRIMIGRGVIQNPALAGKLQRSRSDGTVCGSHEIIPFSDHAASKEVWRAFHDEILEGYIQIMSGDSPVLFKMKDLWTYMSHSFTNYEKYLKKIRKANRIAEYISAVDRLFNEQAILN